MSKDIKYIFAKSCIIKIYFGYIFLIKVRYIRQNIFYMYSNGPEIYFHAKGYISRIYISFSCGHKFPIKISIRSQFLYFAL